MMQWKWMRKNSRQHIVIPEWQDTGVINAFTSRMGGKGTGPYSSCNLGLHVGDDYDTVIANRTVVAEDIGISLNEMVCAEQVHGNHVAIVGINETGRGTATLTDALPGCDAMVTNCSGVYLMEFYADCIPLFFFDPVKRAVGLAHSGWKGTVMRIAGETIKAMCDNYGSRPEDIEVFIGPGIGAECYNVDEVRKAQVEQVFTFADEIIYPIEKQGYQWDLHATNQLILQELGVKADHILSCGLCTACHSQQFFSYRRDEGMTGRMAAIIGIHD